MPWTSPYWWESTQEARDGAAQDFDRSIATQYPKDEVPFQKTAMAQRSGNPELDAAIAEFMLAHKSELGDIHDFSHPMVAWGQCEVVAEECAQFLKSKGFRAEVGDGDLEELGYGDAQPSESVMTPEGPAGEFTYPEHAVVCVLNEQGIVWWTIDFTAAQYGYNEFPKVEPGPPGPLIGPQQQVTSSVGRIPWVTHPTTSQRITGPPGTSLMTHIKQTFGHPSVHDVWNTEYEAGKGEPPRTAKVAGSNPLDNSDAHYNEIICPLCQGTGRDAQDPEMSCYNCHGTGATHGSYPNRPAQYIGQYERTTSYGGPEEGGWHYTHYPHKRSMFIPKEWQGREDELKDYLDKINKGQQTEYRMGPGEYNEQGVYWADDPDYWARREEYWTPEEEAAWDNDVETAETRYLLEHEPGEHHMISLPGEHWDDSGGYLHGAKNDPDYGMAPRITDPFLRLPTPPSGTIAKVAAALEGPSAEDGGYQPLEQGGDYYGGGGCYHLALAMHHMFDLPIAASWGDDDHINHAWVHDGTHAYDAYGVHTPAEAPGWNWSAPVVLDQDPAELAERIGISYDPQDPWVNPAMFDAEDFANLHFRPKSSQ